MESTLISLIRSRGTLFLNWLVEIFLKLGIYKYRRFWHSYCARIAKKSMEQIT
jgi:hypothetical protein